MSIRHGDVKRQGSPKAVSKDERHPGLFIIQITLNISPDKDWIECFRNPRTYVLEEAHPKLAKIWRNIVEFRSSEEHLKENIEWMDKYIGQANDCYSRRVAGEEVDAKKQEAKATNEREELEAINKMLGRL